MGVGSRDTDPGLFSAAVWKAGTLGLLAILNARSHQPGSAGATIGSREQTHCCCRT